MVASSPWRYANGKVLYSRKDAVWKLTDFAFTKRIGSRSFAFTSSIWGTPGYRAPEFLLPGDKLLYDHKSDIWSLGCILYELSVGRPLFEGDYSTMRCKDNGLLPEIAFSDDNSLGDEEKEEIRRAVTKMLQLDSNTRPTAKDLLAEFLSNHERTTAGAQPQHIHIYEEFQSIRQEIRTTRDGFNTTQAEFTTTQFRSTRQESAPSEPENELSRFRALNLDQQKDLVLMAIEKEPLSFWLRHALSTLYADQDNRRGALEAFEHEFQKFPHIPAISMELMTLHAANTDYTKAIGYGDKLLRMSPKEVQNALVLPDNPQVLGIIHNFKAKEISLELYVPMKTLSDLFQLVAQNKRQFRLRQTMAKSKRCIRAKPRGLQSSCPFVLRGLVGKSKSD
jgi:serine/threonine protein kinase